MKPFWVAIKIGTGYINIWDSYDTHIPIGVCQAESEKEAERIFTESMGEGKFDFVDGPFTSCNKPE